MCILHTIFTLLVLVLVLFEFGFGFDTLKDNYMIIVANTLEICFIQKLCWEWINKIQQLFEVMEPTTHVVSICLVPNNELKYDFE